MQRHLLNRVSRQQLSSAGAEADPDCSLLALAADDDSVAILEEFPLLAVALLQRDGLGPAPAELEHGTERSGLLGHSRQKINIR